MIRKKQSLHKAVIIALNLVMVIGLVNREKALAAPQSVFINEIHYDNASTDTGEAVELIGPAGTDLSGWSLTLYNGVSGAAYSTTALSDSIPHLGSGYGVVVVNYPSNGLQNGSPDGLALVDSGSSVVQFLSYEGSFVAIDGPASGMISMDIGVAETSSTEVGYSLQLTGTGTVYDDFTWSPAAANTFGTFNTDQGFSSPTVQQPSFVKKINVYTGWFASPIVHSLGGSSKKIISTTYKIDVWDANGNELDTVTTASRIYAPAVVADLEGDGIFEIIAGTDEQVEAYEWKADQLSVKSGWPVSVCSAGQCPEVRGLAAADIDNNGSIEIVAITTQTDPDGAQVFVFSPSGALYQPPGLSFTAWPRYNTASGEGNDADANGPGNHGYGCYGLNVGIGNLDDDPEKEIVVTFDNHQINVFQHTGVSMLASAYFTNRDPGYSGNRLNWGQFIRWFDADVEHNHYHLHTGDWPSPSTKKWMQWTASPPSVADINNDGKNEVVCVSNVEMDEPYDTKHHSIMVLQGSYDGGGESAKRLPGWEVLPSSEYPLSTGGSWYPPANPPAPTIADINNDNKYEILYAAHDGHLYCTSSDAQQLWRRDIRHGRQLMYASEIVAVDMNQDGTSELVVTTYGPPHNENTLPHGYLMVLDNNGNIIHDLELPEQGTNGNGKGAPAAPTVMDLDGNGTLEILVQTFGAGIFLYTVPGSSENLQLWPTARGNFLRDGRPVLFKEKAVLSPIYFLLID